MENKMNKIKLIICNQIAIMEALKVIIHSDKPDLWGPMAVTWQFDHLKKMIEASQK